jgi:hypothetical protein
MASDPGPYELWKEAGGGTPQYSQERYRELMLKHQLLIPLEEGEEPKPLSCGWPHKEES